VLESGSSVAISATGGVMNNDKENRTSANNEKIFVIGFVFNTSM
jgi:hypothetical protein